MAISNLLTKTVIFGGTTEGRQLAEFCSQLQLETLVCVATEFGETVAPELPHVRYHVGKLDRNGMVDLLRETQPHIVVDATHPFATVVTENVSAACVETGVQYLRVQRQGEITQAAEDLQIFPDIESTVAWLNTTTGIIFATTGAKEAEALTMQTELQNKYSDFQANQNQYSDLIKQTKIKALEDLQARLQDYQQNAQKVIEEQRTSLFNPLIEKARAAIAEVAKEHKYTYVFDAAGGMLLYSSESEDIMELVKKKLNLK